MNSTYNIGAKSCARWRNKAPPQQGTATQPPQLLHRFKAVCQPCEVIDGQRKGYPGRSAHPVQNAWANSKIFVGNTVHRNVSEQSSLVARLICILLVGPPLHYLLPDFIPFPWVLLPSLSTWNSISENTALNFLSLYLYIINHLVWIGYNNCIKVWSH